MALQAADVADIVAGTLRDLGEDHWTDLTSDLQKHIAFKRLFNKNKTQFQSGYECQFQAMVGNNGSFRHVALDDVDTAHFGDVMKSLTVPWRHSNFNMAVNEVLLQMNGSPRRIFSYIKAQKAAAMISGVEGMETTFWSKPVDSTDVRTPYGLFYWVTASGATSTFGFNGGNPSGFTSGAANLSSTDYPRWANGNVTYSAISKADALPKIWEATTKCKFESPVDMPTYHKEGKGYGIYTTYPGYVGMKLLAEAQRDDLGWDLDSAEGNASVRRVKIEWAPKLDSVASSTDPFYGIDWGSLETRVFAGRWMKQYGPKVMPTQHLMIETQWDCSWQIVCTDRRRNWVVTK